MINITKANIGEVVVTGSFDIPFSVKPEQGSNEVKHGTLRFKMNQTPLTSIIGSSLKDKRINEQVKMRANFNSIKEGAIIEVNYEGGRVPVDPRAAFKEAYLAAKTDAERAKVIAEWTGE